jgi:ABC-type dipeptide/oligopeptide/nickel transport system permease component
MVGFIIRRLLWTIPVLLLVILMTFLMMRHIQGNPFRHSERAVSPETRRISTASSTSTSRGTSSTRCT